MRGENKFLFGKNDPASTNTIMAMDGANSRIGIGTYTPGSTLDVNGTTILRQTLSVGGATTLTGTLSLGGFANLTAGLYVSSNSSADSDGIEFRHSNGTQGVGIGHNTIYATGGNPNQELGLKGRGNSGVVSKDHFKVASSLSVASASLIDNIHIGQHATGGGSSVGFISHSSASSSREYALAQNSSGLTTLNSASGQPIQFDIGNSEKMRLHTNGYFGIGTTSPSTYLVVGEDGGGHSTATPGIHMKSTSSERKHYVVGQATDRNAFLTWHYNATANSAYAHLGTYGGSNSLALQADGGNVGIGSTSPGTTLDVVGTSKISQTLSIGGATTITGTLSVGGASPTFDSNTNNYLRLSTTLTDGQAMITTLNDSGSYTFGTATDDTWGIYDNNATAYRLKVNTSGNLNLYNSLSVGSDTTINGNLIVVGQTTNVKVQSETIEIGDNMIQLNANTTSSTGYVPDVDFGFYGQTTIGGSVQYAGLAYDKSANAIITFRSSSAPRPNN